MNVSTRKKQRAVLVAALLLCCNSFAALAIGTETLGPVAIADGTDIVGNGVGLLDGPETMTIEIPEGTTVEQVLLYWNGFHTLMGNGEDTIMIEVDGGGQMAIDGTLIGGPTLFFNNNWSSTYRADLTAMNLITAPGSYSVEVAPFGGVGFNQANNGASILVVVNDPNKVTSVQLADGQDLAYRRFAEPLRTTFPQTFNFPAAAQDRFLTLTMIAGSVQGSASTGGVIRPNIVDVKFDSTTIRFSNPFNSFTGDEWDHVCNSPSACENVISPLLDVVIPAGFTTVTIEAISAGFCSTDVGRACMLDGDCEGGGTCQIAAPNEPKPASFVWMATAMSLRVPTCGDGIVDPGEFCDDGNNIDDDGCRNDCTACGDGIVNDGETCDPPGDSAGASGNDCRGDCTVCGDGVQDPGEFCDDGNNIDDDGCRNDCTACGDGIVNNGETCDPPGDPAGASGNDCRGDCTVCGDGVQDPGEFCDDGNNIDDDGCRNDCTACGDGIVNDGETCDPPGDPAGASGNDCRGDCTVCGDGVQDPGEFCDDGNNIDDDGCRNDCTACGDGIVNHGETCDPPGDPAGASGNECRAECTVCGDGVQDPGEDCDDGNSDNLDDCSNACRRGCEVRLDKQISCDGGDNYVDTGFDDNVASTCIGWDGDDEIKVRYVVDTDVSGELVNCQLIDSNGTVLGGPIDIGTLDGNLDEFVIWETSAIECSEQLEADEPNTATLSCECFEPGSGVGVNASDQANIECQAAALNVTKECGNQDPATGESPVSITVSNPPNPRGASLINCEVIDELANNFVSAPFSLAPGEVRDFDLTVTGLAEPTLNIVWVHCEIVGSGGKRIMADDLDMCRVCPDITLDKQVSCDGGDTFVDVGDDNGAVETCMGREGGESEIVARYIVNGMINGYHGPCELVDSNGEILPNPQVVFGFPGDVLETSPTDCTEVLEANEPNTATVTCDCYSVDSGFEVSATDMANIECASPRCGDGELDDGETCDPPGDPAGASGNDCRDDCTVCGDGVVDSVETCDDGNNNNRDDCRDDCSFCGDGQLDRGEDCDDGNNDADDGCSPECRTEELCDLEVVKTCIVPDSAAGDDDDDDDDCIGKVVSMKLQYTGEGCDATNNDQEGRAGCWGGANGSEPVSVKVSDERGDNVYANVDGVYLGDIVEATAANAGQNEFTSQTSAWIDHGLEDITFHTSCSKPLAVGDQFGSMLVVELTTTKGGTVTLPQVVGPINPDTETSECTIPARPSGPHCDGRVQVLGFRYLGGDCSDSDNEQGDRFSCDGDAELTDPVRITCKKDGTTYLDTEAAHVSLGDVVEVVAANASRTELPSEIACWIRDGGGEFLQDLRLHTSCSRPLNLGDRFGALEVYSLDTSNGGIAGMATEVLYRYRITNHSAVAAENVTAVDSELGELPGSPVASIAADEMVLLEASAPVSETTTNTVTVTATLETGEVCEAVEDTATVTVEETPVLEECTSKIDAMLLQYIGSDIAGPVTIEFLPRTQSNPVVYEFPGGLDNGTIVTSDAQNGFSVDPGVQGQDDAGSKTSIFINGDEEVHHTSCSTPYISGLPAPLDNPKGDPSSNWFVVNFTQK